MHNQMSDSFKKKLSKYQCGFRKGFGTQHCLVEELRKIRVKNVFFFAAVFTDPSISLIEKSKNKDRLQFQ